MENAKENLVFHFAVGRHAPFPQKPVVKDTTILSTYFYLFFQISISQIASSDHTQDYMKIQSMFRLYKMWLARFPQVNSWRFAYQIALIILWNTGATSNDCDTLISRISSIRDRYQAYFVHKLSQENSDRRLFPDDFAETALKELMQITAN